MDADKTNPTCRDCVDRLEYVAALGEMDRGVPIEMTENVTTFGDPPMSPMRPEYLPKVCKNPDCEHGGKPQSTHPETGNFYKSKSWQSKKNPHGLMPYCKECHKKKNSDYYNRKKWKGYKSQAGKKKHDNRLVIDISEVPELAEKIELLADRERRKFNDQVIVMLTRCVHRKLQDWDRIYDNSN
jgi:hypothetical protein